MYNTQDSEQNIQEEKITYTYKSPWILWRKAVYISIFFILTPIALIGSLYSLSSITFQERGHNIIAKQPPSINKPGYHIFASLPDEQPAVSGEVIGEDSRPEILRSYLKRHNSPLFSHADYLVETADRYELDYRLITAIAQKESGLCKVIPENTYNCWGWGIHSQGTLGFSSWEEGIETVSKGLKEKYIDMGYITVEDIMKKYAHPSSTTWADGVLMYMEQIEASPSS